MEEIYLYKGKLEGIEQMIEELGVSLWPRRIEKKE